MMCIIPYVIHTHNYDSTATYIDTSSDNYDDTTNGTAHVDNTNRMNTNRNNDTYPQLILIHVHQLFRIQYALL